jgi:SAM-dependent methyltransferase
MDILDVGCGNGKQIVEALRVLGGQGSVTGVDICPEAVEQIRQETGNPTNLELAVADMRTLGSLNFRISKFDLVQSTYALYYGVEHVKVLEAMRSRLKPGGRLLVHTPAGPNSLRNVINRLGFPTPELAPIDQFGSHVLEPYFRTFFAQVDIQYRRNHLRIPSWEAVLELYRSTAYHFEAAEGPLEQVVRAEIASNGHFLFEKNAYMICGRP